MIDWFFLFMLVYNLNPLLYMSKHRLLILIIFSIMAIEVLSASKTLAQSKTSS